MIVEIPNGVTIKQNKFTQQIKKYEMKYFVHRCILYIYIQIELFSYKMKRYER